jgi:hypothetical protein
MKNSSRKSLVSGLAVKAAFAAFVFLTLNLSSQAAFQESLWGARPAGMAGAFTALADDANAPAYNPAGISFLEHNEFTMMYAQLFTGLDLQVGQTETSKLGLGYFSYVPRIKNKEYGSYAISWSNFVASNLLREDAFTLTFANNFKLDSLPRQPIFAYGANLKMLARSFSTDSRTSNDRTFSGGRDADAWTGDIGLMARPNFSLLPGLKFGLSAQNLTEPDIGLNTRDRVPAKYTLGIAYQDLKFRLLNPALDISRRDGRTLVTMAWEGWMMQDAFAFRLGGNEDNLGGGLGYQFRLREGIFMRLDYSLLWPLEVEGSSGSHRLSLTTDF